jgi:glucosamine-6-phosphate deaminase
MIREIANDKLKGRIFSSREEMGRNGAANAAGYIRSLLSEKESVNILFAAAPSQNELLHYLSLEEGIEWKRVNAFHMDEYIGLGMDAPQTFGNYLRKNIFDKLPLGKIYYINGISDDPTDTCSRYTELLDENPLDFGFFGIGENGHIAFNDPHVAFFDDPFDVKVVELDAACRMQQVNDGCFPALDEVPTHAITLTIPALIKVPAIFCTVPGINKANAVKETFTGAITEDCPASILRRHDNTVVYLDSKSASLIMESENTI